jgi:hypothetical protein
MNIFHDCKKYEKYQNSLLKWVVPQQDNASTPLYGTILTSGNFHLLGLMKDFGGHNLEHICLPAVSSEVLSTAWFTKPVSGKVFGF